MAAHGSGILDWVIQDMLALQAMEADYLYTKV